MFRIDTKNKTNIKFSLYSSTDNKISEIPNKYVEYVEFVYKDIPTISLKIPTMASNFQYNRIYNIIK